MISSTAVLSREGLSPHEGGRPGACAELTNDRIEILPF
jgi:hypothetical protein